MIVIFPETYTCGMVKKKNSIEQTTLKKNTTVYIIKQIKILLLRSSILD